MESVRVAGSGSAGIMLPALPVFSGWNRVTPVPRRHARFRDLQGTIR